jgi:hypothetical protein
VNALWRLVFVLRSNQCWHGRLSVLHRGGLACTFCASEGTRQRLRSSARRLSGRRV